MPRHPFVVGRRYTDRRGTYEVLALTRDQVTIQYDDGHRTTGSIATRAQILANIAAEFRARHPHTSPAYFRTLGFLVRHGDFQAEVPPKARATFEGQYQAITGSRPVPHNDGYFPIDVVRNEDKWGAELRINFPERADLEFPANVETRAGANADTLRINNNSYWWQLVRVGFRLGTTHDADQIRASLPPDHRADYDQGLTL